MSHSPLTEQLWILPLRKPKKLREHAAVTAHPACVNYMSLCALLHLCVCARASKYPYVMNLPERPV